MKNFKLYLLLFTTITAVSVYGQNKKIMKPIKYNEDKPLDIKPSATSSENDFNFLEGKWKVHNRMLKSRLSNSNEWIEFESELHLRKALNGIGNVENYYATFNDKSFEGMAVRLYNPKTRLWKVYWIVIMVLWIQNPLQDLLKTE
jgi:hypothetical protein